jgi:hypothetical protein
VGLLAIAVSRRANSSALLLVGLLLAVAGIGLALSAARTRVKSYARELMPVPPDAGADPFADDSNPVPEDAFQQPLRYAGTAASPRGISEGLVLEVSEWGLRLRTGWLGRLKRQRHLSWQRPWRSVESVDLPELAKIRSAHRPVKISINDPSSVFLFFTPRPEALAQVLRSRIARPTPERS